MQNVSSICLAVLTQLVNVCLYGNPKRALLDLENKSTSFRKRKEKYGESKYSVANVTSC